MRNYFDYQEISTADTFSGTVIGPVVNWKPVICFSPRKLPKTGHWEFSLRCRPFT
ncbi:MAG: hypothetical protein ACXAC7_16750 [Candidatus Hodarchaeales archaeon]